MKEFEKNVTQKVYICENCGHEYSNPSDIWKCAICGKEICRYCGANRLNIQNNKIEEWDIDSQIEQDEQYYFSQDDNTLDFCKKCNEDYQEQKAKIIRKHLDKEHELINDFNSKSDKIVKEALNEIKSLAKGKQ